MTAAKHPGVTPLSVARALRVLGTHGSNWRKLNRLTAAQVAERAGISRDTLRAIEQGKGTASTENLLRVLRIIGIMDVVVKSADPYETDVGRVRMDEILCPSGCATDGRTGPRRGHRRDRRAGTGRGDSVGS
jgi:DNA-binding XRE family transcriptional regulator